MFFNIAKNLKYLSQQFGQHHIITQQDIHMFLRQLATLITAGISLIQSLTILEQSQHKVAMRLFILTIEKEIFAGQQLFTSIYVHKQYFGEIICALIRVGEQSGKLDLMLATAADYYEKNLLLKNKIKLILFYPCILLFILLLIVLSMFIFIIPKFAQLFQALPVKLPLYTRLLFAIADQLPVVMLMISLFVIIIFYYLKKLSPLHNNFQNMVVKLPYIRHLYHKLALARFMKNFSITFAAGMPIKDALKLSADAALHTELKTIINKIILQINAGLQLHLAMEKLNYFPLIMIHMIKIGEESGMLVLMLDKITEFLEEEIRQMTHKLTQLLEPLIMLVLGVVIGGIVIGMYLPIFKLGTAL